MDEIEDREVGAYVQASICLERTRGPVIRAEARRNRTAHRQFERDVRPMGQFSEDEGDMTVLALSILRRMRKNRHTTGAGSYLLGDESSRVYVVAEGNSTGMGFVNRNEVWTVGRYCAGLRGEFPMVEQLIGDLQEHFRSIPKAEVVAA